MVRISRTISLAAILLLIILASPILSAHIASANGGCQFDVWVAPPPLGNDANPGTFAQPFEKIQTGINNVCTGGTVHVAAGTYQENLEIERSLTMIGAGAPTTIIDGNNDGRVLWIASDVGQIDTISNFTIQNGHITWGNRNRDTGMPVGGGVYVLYGHEVTINNCTIKHNIADYFGGGVYNAGKITLNRCTVSGNSAGQIGGGIANFVDEKPQEGDDLYGSMSLVNCTIDGNSVGQMFEDLNPSPEFADEAIKYLLGGGVYSGGNASFLNVTIANNTVSATAKAQRSGTNFFSTPIAHAVLTITESHGGGFANVPLQCLKDKGEPIFTSVATFKNTIVADNFPENGYNYFGTVISSGHNLDSENSCGFDATGDLVNTDPMLGPLQDNGGPTFTCALPIDSPAVDAGDNSGAPDTDQRGVTRPQGTTVDIGAFELEGGGLPPSTEAQPGVSPSNPNNWTRNLNPPTLSVQFVSINPQQATANQPVTISTNVVNTGDQGGNMNVALKINGQVEQTKTVSVGPQASQPIKFTVTKAQPGKYSVDIGGQTGSFIIPDSRVTQSAPSAGLIALIIIGIFVLATVMVLVLSRRSA